MKLIEPRALELKKMYVVQQLKASEGEVIWDTLTGAFWERPTAEQWVDHLTKGVCSPETPTYRIVPLSVVTLSETSVPPATPLPAPTTCGIVEPRPEGDFT